MRINGLYRLRTRKANMIRTNPDRITQLLMHRPEFPDVILFIGMPESPEWETESGGKRAGERGEWVQVEIVEEVRKEEEGWWEEELESERTLGEEGPAGEKERDEDRVRLHVDDHVERCEVSESERTS